MLELRDVSRIYKSRFEETHALDGVSLTVTEGKSCGIVGESGAGKSTILGLLLGLDQPTSGEVLFRGEPLPQRDRARMKAFRSQVQMVFQDPRSSLDPRMSVGRIIAEPLRSLRVPGDHRARVHEVMEWVGLEPDMADRYPAQFSGGQRQRIAIARALAPNPGLLVADEPVSALDVSVKAQLIDLLAELKEKLGLTMLMVSHDIAVVAHLCEETVVLRHGKVVEAGQARQILAAPTSDYTKQLLDAIPVL
ncbi:ABC transporter ATP-binding protein [Arcanobacterium haemolyticum]|nr:ABC transporter ATP-binding protein [Arcanobacterium haemolyticum]